MPSTIIAHSQVTECKQTKLEWRIAGEEQPPQAFRARGFLGCTIYVAQADGHDWYGQSEEDAILNIGDGEASEAAYHAACNARLRQVWSEDQEATA